MRRETICASREREGRAPRRPRAVGGSCASACVAATRDPRSMTLSDGVHSVKAMLGPKFTEDCKSGAIATCALVKLTNASAVPLAGGVCVARPRGVPFRVWT